MDYYENLKIGSVFSGATYRITKEEMVAFARKWDPRPMHVDDRAAKQTSFGELIASAAYVAAIRSLLAYEVGMQHRPETVLVGLSEEQHFPNPVRAGDVLRYQAELKKKRASQSNPHEGIVWYFQQLLNQNDQPVLEGIGVAKVKKRPECTNPA